MRLARIGATLGAGMLLLAAVPSCTATAGVSEVYTGLDKDRRRTVFFTDSIEVHCFALASAGRNNATLEVYIRQVQRFIYAENRFVNTNRVLGYVDLLLPKTEGQPGVIDVALARLDEEGKPKDDAPFVAGRYVCEAYLDGEAAGLATFNIDFPPCPFAFISVGGPCLGFYKPDTECPKYGLSSNDPAKCRCPAPPASGGWTCDQD